MELEGDEQLGGRFAYMNIGGVEAEGDISQLTIPADPGPAAIAEGYDGDNTHDDDEYDVESLLMGKEDGDVSAAENRLRLPPWTIRVYDDSAILDRLHDRIFTWDEIQLKNEGEVDIIVHGFWLDTGSANDYRYILGGLSEAKCPKSLRNHIVNRVLPAFFCSIKDPNLIRKRSRESPSIGPGSVCWYDPLANFHKACTKADRALLHAQRRIQGPPQAPRRARTCSSKKRSRVDEAANESGHARTNLAGLLALYAQACGKEEALGTAKSPWEFYSFMGMRHWFKVKPCSPLKTAWSLLCEDKTDIYNHSGNQNERLIMRASSTWISSEFLS